MGNNLPKSKPHNKHSTLLNLIGDVVDIQKQHYIVQDFKNREHKYFCHIAKSVNDNIQIGDKVKFQVSVYDLTKGRIIQRLEKSSEKSSETSVQESLKYIDVYNTIQKNM